MIASGTGCCGMIDYVDTRVKSRQWKRDRERK
nr:MAG TPA: hypothetical protein [Caudoviricetes sp.]